MIHSVRQLFRINTPVINKTLGAMLVVSGFYMFAFGMFSPLYALFVEEVGGDITTASNAWAVFLLTSGFLTFLTGKWENGLKNKTVGIAMAQFVAAAGYMTYYFANEVAMLYMAQILLGIAAAFFWPAFHSIYSGHIDKHNAPKQWSFYDALAYLVPAISAVLGGWIVKNYGFDEIFIIMTVLSVICGLYILLLPKKLF